MVRTDLAVGAADNSAQPDRVLRVGDDEIFGMQVPLHTVQRGQFLPGSGAAHDNRRVLDRIQVKGVQRLVVLQHDEVGDVHHVADGTQAGPCQPVLQPLG